jgi:hypothetical protein
LTIDRQERLLLEVAINLIFGKRVFGSWEKSWGHNGWWLNAYSSADPDQHEEK